MRAKLIFSINPGRSGSEYLARLLGTAVDVCAFHEHAPQMTGPYLEMINRRPYEETRHLRSFKAAAVNEFLRRHRPMSYADSSHMFVKTFHDVIVAECEGLHVVLLRRRLACVLKSFAELSYFHQHQGALEWMSSPNAVTAAARAIDEDEKLDPFDKSIAYLVDVEARAIRFKTTNPDVPVHEVTLDELNSEAGVKRLFDALGIVATRATAQRIGLRVNERTARKAERASPRTLDYCEERIDRYFRRARSLGIELPAGLLL